MNLQEERRLYRYHYLRFHRMSIDRLEQLLGELGRERFVDYTTDCFIEHRVAARVYLEKTRKGDGLVFHLKSFMG